MAPEIDRAMRWCRQSGRRIGLLSVADGPGSFTGLRIAVTTAKTLSYAWSVPLVSVDSLASIAAAAFHTQTTATRVLVALNAYRNQVFYGLFERSALLGSSNERFAATPLADNWTSHPDTVGIADSQQWSERLRGRDAETAVAGDAAPLGALAEHALTRQCDAIGVGLLGLRAARRNQWVDPLQLVPRYLKPSAAEEKKLSS